MNYDDFPILKNEDYQILNEQFNIVQFDRKSTLKNLCSELSVCSNSCLSLYSLHNSKTQKALKETHICLEKIFGNLTSFFNISHKNDTILNLNLFSFLKKISSLINGFLNWAKLEHKEYYKSLAFKSAEEICNHLKIIFSSLEESNILTFKHM